MGSKALSTEEEAPTDSAHTVVLPMETELPSSESAKVHDETMDSSVQPSIESETQAKFPEELPKDDHATPPKTSVAPMTGPHYSIDTSEESLKAYITAGAAQRRKQQNYCC